jgi:hypothetical protein
MVVTIDWTAIVTVGSRQTEISKEFGSLQAGLPVRLNWTVVDIDSTNQMSIMTGVCPKCNCQRNDGSDGGLPNCPAFWQKSLFDIFFP